MQAECKRAVASLASLSNDELDAIMNDDSRVSEILQGLDQVRAGRFRGRNVDCSEFQHYLKEVENEKDTLMASNDSLAEHNLTKEPELVEGRERIERMSKEGEELSKRVRELAEELSKLDEILMSVRKLNKHTLNIKWNFIVTSGYDFV